MRQVGFLSMDNLAGFSTYEQCTLAPLAARGITVDVVSWRAKNVDWSRYELVIIRTPWDYQQDAAAFLQTLRKIAAATRLENCLSLCEWNLHKTYLRDLEERGIPIVPTRWGEGSTPQATLFDELGVDEVVIKPVVSANADHTYRLSRDTFHARAAELSSCFQSRPWLAQPFMPQIVAEGEYSLFYLGGEYSHAVLKTPRRGDFRVQEEHGGVITAIEPTPSLRAAGDAVMRGLPEPTLYARPDFVRDGDAWRVMEVELIEPSLYFPYAPAAAERFADVVASTLSEG